MRKETRCRHIAARVLLYASSHRQDNTYHGLCYTNRGALAGTRNNYMGPPCRIDPATHRTMSERSYHGATSRSKMAGMQKPLYNIFRSNAICLMLLIFFNNIMYGPATPGKFLTYMSALHTKRHAGNPSRALARPCHWSRAPRCSPPGQNCSVLCFT